MAHSIYETLLEHILHGRYAPGELLQEQQIARKFKTSRTPVREALLRLRAEGLVRAIPRGGIFVAEASIKTIREVTEVRLVLEEALARLAVLRCSKTLLDEYARWLADLEPGWNKLGPDGWMKRDTEFHQLLDRAAGNATLSQHLSLLRNQAFLFWGQSAGRDDLEGILEDFKNVGRALKNQNADKCVKVLQRHVLLHIEKIQQSMKPDCVNLTGAGVLY